MFPSASVCWPCPTSSCHCANSLSLILLPRRLFSVSFRTVMIFQSEEQQRDAATISAREPFIITGRICWKSPPNTTVMPPKGFLDLLTSWNSLSTASKICLCCIMASSHMTQIVILRRSACKEFMEILQVLDSEMLSGILKRECAVRPPERRTAAIPDDATQRTILP